MAEIAKSGTPTYCSVTPPQSSTIVGLLAGEPIAGGDACYIKASDGRVWRATGAANTAPADVAGFAFAAASAGDAVTLVCDGNFRYGAALTVSAKYYLSGTVAGGLADAASVGGLSPVAVAIDATRIRIVPSGLFA
ncbi:MAG: hypothetical protein M3Q74_00915 [Pseudomonadota bacterium]|nr:hypothetical protein [Pseudomonadota bacterium]